MKLVRALYGLKSSGAAWRAMFSTFITEHLKFKSTRIDPDVYIRRNHKKNGQPYYEMLLVYVDDVLLISHAPDEVMEQIAGEFEIKNNEWGASSNSISYSLVSSNGLLCVLPTGTPLSSTTLRTTVAFCFVTMLASFV